MSARLNEAMRLSNFEPRALLPGALACFSDVGGGVYGLPVAVHPIYVLCSVQALEASGLPVPPPASWTVEDFAAACLAVDAATRAGKRTGVIAALPPMVGKVRVGAATYSGSLAMSALWTAFVLGYGGSIVRGGRFALDNPGAVEGLARLVSLAREYGAPSADLLTFNTGGLRPGTAPAFWFLPYLGEGVPGPAWCAARMPRFPVRPVVPADAEGVTLVRPAGGTGYTTSYTQAPPAAALRAVVEYALWRYGISRANPSGSYLPPPVLGAAAAQRGYWEAQAKRAPGLGALGDWQQYVFTGAGWPSVAPRVTAVMYQALSEAVTNGAHLATLLAAASRKMNNLIAA